MPELGGHERERGRRGEEEPADRERAEAVAALEPRADPGPGGLDERVALGIRVEPPRRWPASRVGRVRSAVAIGPIYRTRVRGGLARSLVRGIAQRPRCRSPVGGIRRRNAAGEETEDRGERVCGTQSTAARRPRCSSSARLIVAPTAANAACPSAPIAREFARWLDPINYTIVPGGHFESGASGWKLSGGARIVSGNERFHLRAASDGRSLYLPGGSSRRRRSSAWSCSTRSRAT